MPTDQTNAILEKALVELRKRGARIAELEMQQGVRAEPIALIGKAIRLPGGVATPAQFWELLNSGASTVTVIDDPALAPASEGERYAALLGNTDWFDPGFFGLSQTEAQNMDPQQRLLLELCWDAFHDAALAPALLAGRRVAVVTATAGSDYAALVHGPAQLGAINAFTTLGAAASVSAGRISYVHDFRGPALHVDASCASGLAAVHLAAAMLQRGEADLAVVAATNLLHGPGSLLGLSRMGALSARGRCAAFSDDADGYVRAEGGAAIVLKPLDAALRDQDPIAGVVRGSAMNHDGRSNGLAAPNGTAQTEVIRAALAQAGASGSALWYVEAHGTGTRLGDPIEIAALTAALDRPVTQPLAIGSVKANVGHLEAAAGLVGLVKLLLMLEHRTIPPQPGLTTLNRLVDWTSTPLRPVQTTTRAEPRPAAELPTSVPPLLTAISSFGMSGTNVHLVLESPPLPSSASSGATAVAPLAMLPLAARTAADLDALRRVYLARSATLSAAELAPLLVAAQRVDSAMAYRQALPASSVATLATVLSAAPSAVAAVAAPAPRIAFVFQGQGAAHAGMARGWHQACPVFREAFDTLLPPARPAATQLRGLLLEAGGDAAMSETRHAQACLFVYGYALAASIRSHGVTPAIVAGHSLGEWIAAAVAGHLQPEQALALVMQRAAIMQDADPGAMLALFCDREQAVALAGSTCELAGCNGPSHQVVAGPALNIVTVAAAAKAHGIASKPLAVQHAFHSRALDPHLPALATAFSGIACRDGAIPLVSGIDGALCAGSVLDADYWVRQTRAAVRFDAVQATLQAHAVTHVLDIGPGAVLQAFWPGPDAWRVLGIGHRHHAAPATLAALLGTLYTDGLAVNWLGQRRPAAVPAAAPGYPWQRRQMTDQYLLARGRAGAVETRVPEDTNELVWEAARADAALIDPVPTLTRLALLADAMLQEWAPLLAMRPTALHGAAAVAPALAQVRLRAPARLQAGAAVVLEQRAAADGPWRPVLSGELLDRAGLSLTPCASLS